MSYLNHLDEFKCQRCLNCCTNPGNIYVSKNEVAQIAEYLKISEEDFLNSYCDLIQKPRLTLKNKADGACIMLEGNACQIHPVKPKQCKDFPLIWSTKDALSYCFGLQLLAQKHGV